MRLPVLVLAAFAFAGALNAAPEARSFNIPAGDAGPALRRFAEQSGRQLLFDPDVVSGERTAAVRGSLPPVVALRRLVAGTRLTVVEDERSGALSVRRAVGPTGEARSGGDNGEPAAPQPAVAGGTGAIAGTVSNRATGAYLDKAEVVLAGTERVVFTETGGGFTLAGVPSGVHTLVISYTGLTPERRAVTVAPGAITRVEVALDSEIYALEAFVVAGEREGRAEAITKQRRAENLVSVVAADEFTNLAGGALGEFMRNLPGVTVDYSGQGGSDARFIRVRGMDPALNSVTIDGFRAPNASSGNPTRAYEIDQVSLQNIERIEVTKAPTPAMDGDSIGGSVNLVGKSAFAQKGRRISYNLSFNGPATDQFSFRQTYGGGDNTSAKIRPGGNLSYSDTLLGGRLGVVLTANAYSYYAPSPRAIAAYTYPGGANGPRIGAADAWQRQLQITDGGPTTSRQSYSMNLDYKVDEHTTLFLRSQLGRSQLDNRGRTFTLQSTTVAPGFTDTAMTAPLAASTQSTSNASFQDKTGEGTNYTLGVKRQSGPWRIDARLALGRSMNRYRSLPAGIRSATLSGNTNISYRLDGRRGDPTPAFTQLAGRDVWNIASYTRLSASDEQVDGLDRIRGGTLNVRRDFEGRFPFFLQTGLNQRRQRRDIATGTRNFTFVGPDGVANTADDNAPGVYSQFRDDVFVHRPFPEYGEVPWPGIRRIGEYFKSTPRAFSENLATTFISYAQGLRATREEVGAAYLMGDVRLGKLGVLGGFRYEETKITGTGAIDDAAAGRAAAAAGGDALAQAQARFARRNTQTHEYDNLFPNLQLRYAVTKNLLLRTSYTETIGRPEFSNVFPSFTVNPDFNNGQGRVTLSGTKLRPQSSENLDASVEFYFEPVGVLSAGAFRKQIADYIRSSTTVVPDGPNNGFDGQYAGYELVTKANLGEARVDGLELNYSQELGGLARWLQGVSVFANYTYVRAQGSFDGTQGALEGFHPRAANAGVSLRRSRLFASVKYNWRGVSISSNSLRRYTDERGIVDLSLSFKAYRQHTLFVEVKNLLSEPTEQYIDVPGRNGRYFTTPARIDFGVKGNF